MMGMHQDKPYQNHGIQGILAPSCYPSPIRPSIKRGKLDTRLWSSIEDQHQYKCYEVTDSPKSSSKDTSDEGFQVPAIV